ncbi:MAG: NAD-dependent epimerase/dehydratase family protein [Prevotella sp.]|nr:NAD-dependent epimerase/dehydratase family protein [Prevotella sp.]
MFSYNNKIVQEDLKEIISYNLPWRKLNGKTVLVTGGNGMLACYLTYTLLYLVGEKGLNITIIVLTRSIDKTKSLYAPFLEKLYFKVLVQDVTLPINCEDKIDYILHFAGNASPTFINNDPVGIVKANLLGTFNVMELARESQTKRVLFASTREVYGAVDAQLLTEESFGALDPLDNRSCYPESKRAAETILRSYFTQYGLDSVIARIAHSYGPGMKITNDGRVMADFIGNAVRNENIVLNSSGEAVRAFLYLSDAIVALFTILFNGKSGEAYNVSNELEALPIYQVAQMICEAFPEKEIKVVFSGEKPKSGYCNYPRVGLDNTKLLSLGFRCRVGLENGIIKTVRSYE